MDAVDDGRAKGRKGASGRVATRRVPWGDNTGLERPAYIRFGATRLSDPLFRFLVDPCFCLLLTPDSLHLQSKDFF
jgi:hypothetical protein